LDGWGERFDAGEDLALFAEEDCDIVSAILAHIRIRDLQSLEGAALGERGTLGNWARTEQEGTGEREKGKGKGGSGNHVQRP
jgi:hypothetical protein